MNWILPALGAVVLAVIFRRPLGKLVRLGVRSGVWLGVLWLLRALAPVTGISLGVSLFNAVVLGLLGVPGLGLLLMTRWLLH